jgi:sulfite oxidase
VDAGSRTVSGYAVAAEGRSVARVDVSADGGRTWVQAEVDDDQPWTWCRWRTRVELAPGEVELLARAWDDTGAQQPSDPAAVWNPKGYANTSWARSCVRVG